VTATGGTAAEPTSGSGWLVGHYAWSAAPRTRSFHLSLGGGDPYHPNAADMAAVAEVVLAALIADHRGTSV